MKRLPGNFLKSCSFSVWLRVYFRKIAQLLRLTSFPNTLKFSNIQKISSRQAAACDLTMASSDTHQWSRQSKLKDWRWFWIGKTRSLCSNFTSSNFLLFLLTWTCYWPVYKTFCLKLRWYEIRPLKMIRSTGTYCRERLPTIIARSFLKQN